MYYARLKKIHLPGNQFGNCWFCILVHLPQQFR